MPIDYTGFAFPKTGQVKTEKARRDVKRIVIERQHGLCIGLGINPKCKRTIVDRHELVPIGRGGSVTPDNCVGVCRTCHRETQGRVGGNRLFFSWYGMGAGRAPQASKPGAIKVRWYPKGKAS